MMSSSVMATRRSVTSCGCTSRISSMASQLVMRTAQVNPSRSPRVTSRILGPPARRRHRNRPARKRKRPGRAAPGVLQVRWCESLDLADVCCAGSFRAVDDLEPYLVALVEGTETLRPDLRMVDEDVMPTLAREETETLRLVEPLHRTFDHEHAASLALSRQPAHLRAHEPKPPTVGGLFRTPEQRLPLQNGRYKSAGSIVTMLGSAR